MQKLTGASILHIVAPMYASALTNAQQTEVKGFNGTKDRSKTKAQMTPSCDNPNCSCFPLSDNISNVLKKKEHLIEQPLPVCLC